MIDSCSKKLTQEQLKCLERYLELLWNKSNLEGDIEKEELVRIGSQIIKEVEATHHLQMTEEGDWESLFDLLKEFKQADVK